MKEREIWAQMCLTLKLFLIIGRFGGDNVKIGNDIKVHIFSGGFYSSHSILVLVLIETEKIRKEDQLGLKILFGTMTVGNIFEDKDDLNLLILFCLLWKFLFFWPGILLHDYVLQMLISHFQCNINHTQIFSVDCHTGSKMLTQFFFWWKTARKHLIYKLTKWATKTKRKAKGLMDPIYCKFSQLTQPSEAMPPVIPKIPRCLSCQRLAGLIQRVSTHRHHTSHSYMAFLSTFCFTLLLTHLGVTEVNVLHSFYRVSFGGHTCGKFPITLRGGGGYSGASLAVWPVRVLRLFLCREQFLRAEETSESCLLSHLQDHYHVMRVQWEHVQTKLCSVSDQQLASTEAATQPEMQLHCSPLFHAFLQSPAVRVQSGAVLCWSGSSVPASVVSTGDRNSLLCDRC